MSRAAGGSLAGSRFVRKRQQDGTCHRSCTYPAEYAMFAVEVRLPVERDEELAAVGVLQQASPQLSAPRWHISET
jgi:hypothetical protein